jgi:GWxTD domain-containing protein
MKVKHLPGILLTLTLISPVPLLGQNQSTDSVRQEEETDYYQKWLNQDVRFIISDEERSVFESLSTDEEKEQFIEQFWFRRDPDPTSAHNEFKEEHYRRIAYANEKFTSGNQGWLTDRGRVYIIHGPPDNLESRPSGGFYNRPIEEGGGNTAVYPFEVWTYRYIEGIGEQVRLEFVDDTYTGEYKLAVFHWEKDLGMRSGTGRTLAELTGLSTRAQHPALMPASGGAMYGPENWFARVGDTPFARYEKVAKIQAAPITKYNDLKELVEVSIQYENLPFNLREQYFKLNEAEVIVPLTLQVENKDLSFQQEDDRHVARMAVYGIVSSLTNRIVAEFEDDFVSSYSSENLEKGLLKSSVYQKVLTLERNMRYKVDFVLKDLNTGKTGIIRKALSPPAFDDKTLVGSSLVLSDQIQTLEIVPDADEMFVLGDVRILPRLNGDFTSQMPLGVYFQVYNAALDQTTLEPSLRVKYSLLQNGELMAAATDEAGESTQFFSGRRIVLLKRLSLSGLEPGKYQIQVEVEDMIRNESVDVKGDFRVVEEG